MKKPKISLLNEDEQRKLKEEEFKKSLETNEVYDLTYQEKRRRAKKRIEITPEKEMKARKNLKDTPLEKHDLLAMIIACFLTIGIPLLIVIVLVIGLACLILL